MKAYYSSSELRDLLGCGQQDMAQLLGIAKSTLSMVELNWRALPPEAGQQLDSLLDLLRADDKPGNPGDEEILTERQTASVILQDEVAILQAELGLLKLKLQRLETKYVECCKRLQLLGKISVEGNGRSAASRRRALNMMRNRQLDRLESCGCGVRFPLMMKIAAIEARIAAGQSCING